MSPLFISGILASCHGDPLAQHSGQPQPGQPRGHPDPWCCPGDTLCSVFCPPSPLPPWLLLGLRSWAGGRTWCQALGVLHGHELFPGQEDFAWLHSPSPQGIFQGVSSDCPALGPDAIEQLFSCAKELVGGHHSAMCFFSQQLGTGPWMPVGSLGTGEVMAEGPEVHPAVGGPLGATHPPSDTAVTRMAPPPCPDPEAWQG